MTRDDKARLLATIVTQLETEMERVRRAAQAAYEGATHAESRSEGRYDTRGLEQSYLAGAQAKRVAELKRTIAIFKTLPSRAFAEDDPIVATALVTLENDDETAHYFLAPGAGGMRVDFDGREIVVITPHSPIGMKLLGLELNDEFEISMKGGKRCYEIVDVN